MFRTQHQITGQPGLLLQNSRKLIACGVLLISLAVTGCSAVNMTGFSFPVFGLNGKSSEKNDAVTASSLEEESQLSGASSNRLMTQ